MCLTLKDNWTGAPYNESKTRYKLMHISAGTVHSPYVKTQIWERDRWYEGCQVISEGTLDLYNSHDVSYAEHDHGFHVYITLQDALNANKWMGTYYRIAEMEVGEFIAAGVFGPFMPDPTGEKREWIQCETWRNAKFVKLL